jgi:2-dehydropantoate 2-reductase
MIYQMAFGPHRALKASMLQDLEKGIPCEINTINGKVAEMGSQVDGNLLSAAKCKR